jgi:hypothetical protein
LLKLRGLDGLQIAINQFADVCRLGRREVADRNRSQQCGGCGDCISKALDLWEFKPVPSRTSYGRSRRMTWWSSPSPGTAIPDRQARFYLLPSDSGTESTITDAVLPKFISSDELSQWLREVDAGEIVMLIDACHSAASVPEGFKPGPMGIVG